MKKSKLKFLDLTGRLPLTASVMMHCNNSQPGGQFEACGTDFLTDGES